MEHAGSSPESRRGGLAVELWDSFAERPFAGNVAGVVADAAGLGEGTLQAVAAELGASTTGFVVATEDGPPPAVSVRYFTPVQEIDACGHVTVAVFSALAKAGRLATGAGDRGARVEALLRATAGESRVVVRPEKDGAVAVEMFQRRPEHATSPLRPEEVAGLLGGVPPHPSWPAELSSTGLRHLLVPYSDPEDLGRLRPDFAELAAFGREVEVDTVCAFAPDAGEAGDGVVTRVRARDFCSPIGDDEEPASGTTSGALACYLFRHGIAAPKEAAEGATVAVSVRMGVEMGRPGRVEVCLDVAGGEVRRVSVLGRAIRTLIGVLELPIR